MAWLFEIETGYMYDPEGVLAGIGYAGAPLKPGDPDLGAVGHINDPADESLKNLGPLPEGWYTIKEWVDDPHLGKHCGILVPDKENDMHGRGGFRIHGDNVKKPGTGSEGCIVQPHVTREVMSTSPDQRLQVVERKASSAVA